MRQALPGTALADHGVMATIAVLGAGAIGQFYGVQLLRAGHTLRFCARRDAPRLRTQGVRGTQTPTDQVAGTRQRTDLDEPASAFTVVERAEDLRRDGDPDWLLVAAKLTDGAAVAAQAAAAAGPETRIAVLGNGLGAEELIASRCAPQRIFGMICAVCVNRHADGSIHHQAHGQVMVGHLQDDPEAREALAALCRGAGILTRSCPSLAEARWRKLVWNVPYNGLCTVHDCATDRILADEALRARSLRLMDEVLAVANADLGGDRIPPSWAEEQERRTRAMGPYLPSTTLDLRAGIPLELDLIFAEPLRRAARLGMSTPELAALVRELSLADPARPDRVAP